MADGAPVSDYRVPAGQLRHEGDGRPEVSVVVPVYGNSESLEILYDRLAATLQKVVRRGWDVTFVDDRSADDSRAVLERIRLAHDNVRVIHLAKNHGSTPAVLAGMTYASGDAVAVLAADLQDPPEVLEELVGIWRSGVRVAIASRNSREDPLFTRILAGVYYRLFRWLVTAEMPPGGFDIVVVDQQVSSMMVRHAEKNTNFPAALLALGFERKVIGYHRMARPYGTSKWTFWRKFTLMYDSILSYSYRPLRIMTAVGVLGLAMSLTYAAVIVYYRITSPPQVPGWASLMVVTLFFDGFVLTSLGVVGEYIWRTYNAARRAPLLVIDRVAEPSGRPGGSSVDGAPPQAPRGLGSGAGE